MISDKELLRLLEEVEDTFKNNDHLKALKQISDLVRKYPRHTLVLNTAGIIFARTGQFSESEKYFKTLISIEPNNFRYKYNYVNLLVKEERFNEAELLMKEALSQKKVDDEYYFQYTSLAVKVGKIEEAYEILINLVSKNPNNHDMRFALSTVMLAKGELDNGWKMYESRFLRRRVKVNYKVASKDIVKGNIERYSGQNLSDRTLLIHDEQGYGDLIQFIRYVPLLKERYLNLSVILICKEPISSLMKKLDFIDQVFIYEEQEKINQINADYWDFIMSIPKYFEISFSSLPLHLPYISFDSEIKEEHKNFFHPNKPNIGICFKGNNKHLNDQYRSIQNIKDLSPVLNLKALNFVYLGVDDVSSEAQVNNFSLCNSNSTIESFEDLYSIINNLDLVISVDTSIVHLSGAANKECFAIINSISTDWRWGNDLKDSPWYPSVKIFRKDQKENWHQIFSDVSDFVRKKFDL